MVAPTRPIPRQKRVLAKPLVQGGELREPGETVELRQDQIERLERQGYFEAAAPDKREREKEKSK